MMKQLQLTMCSRIGAYAPRSPEDKSGLRNQATHPFTQPQSRPAELVLVARLWQLRVNGRREHGTLYETDETKKLISGWNMYELTKGQFPIVLPLLDQIQNKAVYSLSVIDNIQRGRIFVNDSHNPTAVFITSAGGFYCLAGQEKDKLFNTSVVRYMNDQTNHNGFFALGIFNDNWDEELSKFRINNSKKIQRSYYRFNKERFIDRFADEVMKVDDRYEYIILNEKISHDYRERFYPYYKMVWDTNEHFCKYGVGHFLKKDDELISVCTSPYIGGKYAEIDIITIERYKRKGLATKLGVEFIKECLKKQLTPNWCCHSDNIESSNLANKLCFEKIAERPMYWYHL